MTSSTSVRRWGQTRLYERADVSTSAADTKWVDSLGIPRPWSVDPLARLLGKSRECAERRASAHETSSVGMQGEHIRIISVETPLTVMYCSFCAPARTTFKDACRR